MDFSVFVFLFTSFVGFVILAIIKGRRVEEQRVEDEDEPRVVVDPAKKLAKQIKFVVSMRRQMTRFKERKECERKEEK